MGQTLTNVRNAVILTQDCYLAIKWHKVKPWLENLYENQVFSTRKNFRQFMTQKLIDKFEKLSVSLGIFTQKRAQQF